MSEMKSKEVLELVEKYVNSDDLEKNELEKRNPHINFQELVEDVDVMWQVWEMSNENDDIPRERTMTTANSQGGNSWINILSTAAVISFCVSIIGGLVSALIVADSLGGLAAFAVFLMMAVGAFIVLAVIMVFLTMAKDISRTAKDTAEIKEILKRK